MNGDDTNSGTLSRPWQTIAKGTSAPADGDSVVVMAGTYPEYIPLDKSNFTVVADGKVEMQGFYITGNGNHVRGFTITNRTSDFGIRVLGDSNRVEYNDISDTKQDGIWFSGSGNTFTGNRIHDIVDRSVFTNDPHVDCFQTWGPATNIVFEKNICDHTCTDGSNQIAQISNVNSPVENIVFKNNVFVMHDPGYSPMTFYHMDQQPQISGVYVINNTFVHLNGIGGNGIWFKNTVNAYAINNIFIDFGTEALPYVLVEEGTNINIHHNAVYKSDGIPPLGGPFSDDVWMQDPGLVDFSNCDFRLKPTSLCIDKGDDMSSQVADDLGGDPRPQGSAFDIGAYEGSN